MTPTPKAKKNENQLIFIDQNRLTHILLNIQVKPMACCGIKEMHGIRSYDNPHQSLLTICVQLANLNDGALIKHPLKKIPAHIVLTQASDKDSELGYGYKLANFIKEKKLGTCYVSETARNPNTNRHITTLLWTPNKPKLKTWYSRQLNAYLRWKADPEAAKPKTTSQPPQTIQTAPPPAAPPVGDDAWQALRRAVVAEAGVAAVRPVQANDHPF